MEKRVELIWMKQVEMDEGQIMQQHCHSCYQMYYILKGEATFVINDDVFKVSSGTCFIIPEMEKHKMLPLNENGLLCYELKFNINDSFLKAHLLNAPKPIKDSVTLNNLLTYIVDNRTSHNEQNVKDIEYILTTIILSFFIRNIYYEDKDSTRIITKGYNDVTRAILVYIEKNFSYSFSLQTLGDRINYNKNYLCYVFKKDTGISIVNYLNFIRIRQSIIFFAFYSQDVYTASLSVGFSNLSHFSRTFRSFVGIAPRDFRRAFLHLGQQEVSKCFANEMIFNYKLCTIEEGLKSLESIGKSAKEILNEMNRNKVL